MRPDPRSPNTPATAHCPHACSDTDAASAYAAKSRRSSRALNSIFCSVSTFDARIGAEYSGT